MYFTKKQIKKNIQTLQQTRMVRPKSIRKSIEIVNEEDEDLGIDENVHDNKQIPIVSKLYRTHMWNQHLIVIKY